MSLRGGVYWPDVIKGHQGFLIRLCGSGAGVRLLGSRFPWASSKASRPAPASSTLTRIWRRIGPQGETTPPLTDGWVAGLPPKPKPWWESASAVCIAGNIGGGELGNANGGQLDFSPAAALSRAGELHLWPAFSRIGGSGDRERKLHNRLDTTLATRKITSLSHDI